MKIFDKLRRFIKESKNKQEIERALAVKMFLEGCTLKEVGNNLDVSFPFISKWKNRYVKHGIEALKLGYRGSVGYLTKAERLKIVAWLNQQPYCTVEKLKTYVWEKYGIRFQSLQSYYALLASANFSFKKSQKRNPKRKASQVAAKRYALKKNVERTSL